MLIVLLNPGPDESYLESVSPRPEDKQVIVMDNKSSEILNYSKVLALKTQQDMNGIKTKPANVH